MQVFNNRFKVHIGLRRNQGIEFCCRFIQKMFLIFAATLKRLNKAAEILKLEAISQLQCRFLQLQCPRKYIKITCNIKFFYNDITSQGYATWCLRVTVSRVSRGRSLLFSTPAQTVSASFSHTPNFKMASSHWPSSATMFFSLTHSSSHLALTSS